MSTLKRTLALLSALAITSVSFAACGGDDESTSGSTSTPATSTSDAASTPAGDSSAPAEEGDGGSEGTEMPEGVTLSTETIDYVEEEGTLTILTWTPDDATPMIDQYKASSGNENVEYVRQGDGGGAAAGLYPEFLLGGNEVDVFMAEADWILDFANSEYAKPLSEVGITVDDLANCYDYTVSIGLNDGELYAASWQACAGGYVYNNALAEQYLGVTSGDAMQEKMKDWDAFKATAAELDEASGGTVDICASLAGLWQVYAANRTEAWVTADGKLNVAEAEGYVTLAKELVDNGYVDGTVGQWNDGWYAQGSTGAALGYFGSTWCLKEVGGQLASWQGIAYDEETGEKIADGNGPWTLINGPQAYCWGGTWLLVANQCNNMGMAGDFIKTFCVNEQEIYKYATTVKDFVNNKNVMTYILENDDTQNALLGGQNHFEVLYDSAAAIDMEGLITDKDAKIKSAFNDAVTKYVNGEADDWSEPFQDAVAEIYPDELVWE